MGNANETAIRTVPADIVSISITIIKKSCAFSDSASNFLNNLELQLSLAEIQQLLLQL